MTSNNERVYILITQCLQNAFFLDNDSRLCLPIAQVLPLLIGYPKEFDVEINTTEEIQQQEAILKQMVPDVSSGFMSFTKFVTSKGKTTLKDVFQSFLHEQAAEQGNKRIIPQHLIQNGPLYLFLKTVLEDRPPTAEPLHVIHIQDWHKATESYDVERRLYGTHCEADTWGAAPIEGFETYLSPWGTNETDKQKALSADGFSKDNVTYHLVQSDSVYDFKPEFHPQNKARFGVKKKSALEETLDTIIKSETQNVYVIVLGVYTDIKVKTLLVNLRSRYPIDNLIVSDVLTAAPSLERHLSGLDFAQKVLQVEVIHNLNDLASVLNPSHKTEISQSVTRNSISFREYQNYFLDKQNLLAYQEAKQLEYIDLTERRATRVYKQSLRTSIILNIFGLGFLFVSLMAALFGLIYPERLTDQYVLTTGLVGGISLAQLLMSFFINPLRQLQKNLNNLIQLRAVLETHSLVLSLLRYHLSKPERLYNHLSPEQETVELSNLEKQINLVLQVATKTSAQFSQIGMDNMNEAQEDGAV